MDVFQIPVTVYYEDTDAGGVVYHANYLKFFERARSEFVKHLGLSNQQVLELGYLWVVNKMEIAFKRPAKLEDELIITVEPIKVGRAKIIFYQTVKLKSDETVLVDAQVSIGSIDAHTFRPKALTDEMRVKLT